MKKFTIITKGGSKWLSLPAPHGVDPIQWHSDNLDLPYIGSHPEGTTVDESEVREVRQYWIDKEWRESPTSCDFFGDFLTRTAYTDAESHDPDISDDYWRKRCEAAERFIAKSPCDNDITPAQEAAYNAWHEIVKEESK